MNIRKFPLFMWSIAILSGVLTVVFAVVPIRALAITCGTFFYHFAMRLAVGAVVPNRFHPEHAWFRQTKIEGKVYKFLKLRRWKGKMPTYDPRLFSKQYYTPEQIVRNMCQAEVVHEIIILLSFIPLLFALLWDSFWVFFFTSVAAAAVDLVFVMMQRYNRPRLLKLLQRSDRL